MSYEESKIALQNSTLYGIIDLGYVTPKELSIRTLQLIAGGVNLIQLRAKNHDKSAIIEWAHEILPLCREASIPFLINDYPDIAVEVKADGVHVGQDDGSIDYVRDIVGEELLIGRSTHTMLQAHRALEDRFDYIGYGPIYPTDTKKGRPSIGVSDLAALTSDSVRSLPTFCIGGINRLNLPYLTEKGVTRVAVVSDLLCAPCPKSATQQIKALLI